MKQEIKTPVLVAIVAVVVLVLGYFGFQSMSGSGNLDKGQVNYTPGKPPWEETDPSKKGPGGPPSGGGYGATNSPAGTTQPGGANVPPGMSAPTLGNGR